eukprot:125478_1
MIYKQGIYSDSFDNDNWCLLISPNGAIVDGRSEFYVQCLHFPHNIKSMDVKVKFEINNKTSQFEMVNFTHGSNRKGGFVGMKFNEFEQIKSLSFSVTLEIMNIYDENDQIIEQSKYEQYGINTVL